jgi:hypothetical protein
MTAKTSPLTTATRRSAMRTFTLSDAALVAIAVVLVIALFHGWG